MPEPLKEIYNADLLRSIAKQLRKRRAHFPVERFIQSTLENQWQERELKDRIACVSRALHESLGDSYKNNLELLKELSPEFSGLGHLFIPTYIELFGLDNPDESIEAMACVTQGSSCEFAVRGFLARYGKRMMQQMSDWADSDDEHIRRLASEGTRLRLPWAVSVPGLKENPEPVIAILEKLKCDPSEYVRRSVANNLNDISKDHPDTVLQIASAWHGMSDETDRLVKHACRSLLKKGHPEAMLLFGFSPPDNMQVVKFVCADQVRVGDRLAFSFLLKCKAGGMGKVRLEYALDFLLANGKRSRKVFKISESESKNLQRKISKQHSFKPITTRRYYPGKQGLAIIVNGCELASCEFHLEK